MGIIRDMQRVHATQTAAHQRAGTAAARQRDLIRRNHDLAVAAAQQAAAAAAQQAESDAERKREHRRLYAEARSADAASLNADLRARLSDLDSLLLSTLDVDDHIDLDQFKKPAQAPPFDPGPLGRPHPEPSWDSYAPPEPRRIGKVLVGERLHQQHMANARQAYQQARERWIEAETRRLRQLAQREQAYEESIRRYETRIAAYNAEVERFAAAVANADPASVVEYFAMVLGNSVYPDDFPQHFRLAYQPNQKHLLIEYHLPPVEVIPVVKEYRYDRVRDDVAAIPRDEAETRRRYTEIIAQVSLRTVHEIVEADRGGLVAKVSFNGIVDTIDRRTGAFVRPCLVSLRTDREVFAGIKLRRVDPVACLKQHLAAGLSEAPDALTAVTPMLDFDAEADRDLTGEFNVLADIDERPNLLALPEDEFAQVVADLFGNMGLAMGTIGREGKGSRWWVATDPRPVFGGKIIVYATRGVPADADTLRALDEEVTVTGATKGILVATGGYEHEVHEAAAGRPLELIDGPALLTLLSEYSRLKARLEPPKER
ncbi:restriction endonuclease [Actinoplanes sp. NBRC 103695]|uniref:restriction endonuclease n=1 Tax=Actinoplanes sp. NBRC 103695 TaxID=3032202 RepID=UPI00249FA7E5|nr:restriction endonuclease [Actinoplanes sp. NBRC 103695]GLY97380.1 restriction endonuclease [Actinoplanes sp. NBRC 103695]